MTVAIRWGVPRLPDVFRYLAAWSHTRKCARLGRAYGKRYVSGKQTFTIAMQVHDPGQSQDEQRRST